MARPASARPQARLPVAARLGRSFNPALTGSRAWTGTTVARPGSASRVVASKCAGSRNLNRVPIGYAQRPRLRGRLTQGGSPFPWKPWAFGGRESHPPFATYACILSSAASSAPRRRAFPGMRNAPLPPAPTRGPAASAWRLAPLHCLRPDARPVSCYALFQGVAASKPTSWLSLHPDLIAHSAPFRGLGRRSGLFPSRP